ncbi:MAG: hypothetical protein AAB492_03735 [Patescibacteria group bacterium]
MVHNERGPAHQSPIPNAQPPIAERVARGSEKGKEKPWVEKVGTKLADIVRDIDTASKMAEDTFDGDSALMRTARGVVNVGVGAGMEKATDALWTNIWQGKSELVERFRMGGDVGEKLNNFALQDSKFNWKARSAYFVKEGVQDLAIGGFYNMILGFRLQPMFVKAEAKHLLASLAIDAGEALFAPDLPKQVQYDAKMGNKALYEGQLDEVFDKLDWLGSKQPRSSKENDRSADFSRTASRLQEKRAIIEDKLKKYENIGDKPIANPIEDFIRKGLNLSNPVSILGVDMIWSGLGELKKNWKEVRQVRNEKGIVGKKVEMPHFVPHGVTSRGKDGRWQGNKDKVYYGKSNWKSADQKAQEEYELKAAS